MNTIDSYFNKYDRQFDLSKLHSNYWMSTLPPPKKNVSLITLASYRRAIARFVRIATRRDDIRVEFHKGQESYTDGENVVVLSARIKNEEFDAASGLALHESYHIKESDMSIIKNIGAIQRKGVKKRLSIEFLGGLFSQEMIYNAKRLKFSYTNAIKLLISFLNFVEDRRIDSIAYRENPGYRPYYDALYKKYFGNKNIVKGLKSANYRIPTVDAYKFFIFNMTNKHFDRNALPGLSKIVDIIDLAHIDRLEKTQDSLNIAKKVLDVVLKNALLLNNSKPDKSNNGESENDESDKSDNSSSNERDDNNNSEPGSSNDSDESGDNESNGKAASESENERKDEESDNESGSEPDDNTNDNESDKDGEKDELKDLPNLDSQTLNAARKSMRDIERLLNNKTHKYKITEEESGIVDELSDDNISIVDISNNQNVTEITKDTVLVIDGIKKIKSLSIIKDTINISSEQSIAAGIRLGKMLANQLVVRNETKVYKSKRKSVGKIDKRLLYSIGLGAEHIFEISKKDQFGDAILHISIDASTSMNGYVWNQTMTAAVAIAYAASKTKNLDIVISFQSISKIATTRFCHNIPTLLIAYDSRKHNFTEIQKFKHLRPAGNTPTGPTLLAAMPNILCSLVGKKGYFLQISDGEPNVGTNDMDAYEAVKVASDKLKKYGVKVMAYLISRDYDIRESFIRTWGKDSAKFINVTKVKPLAKTLNKMFSTVK